MFSILQKQNADGEEKYSNHRYKKKPRFFFLIFLGGKKKALSAEISLTVRYSKSYKGKQSIRINHKLTPWEKGKKKKE